jgi:hypothetical protein
MFQYLYNKHVKQFFFRKKVSRQFFALSLILLLHQTASHVLFQLLKKQSFIFEHFCIYIFLHRSYKQNSFYIDNVIHTRPTAGITAPTLREKKDFEQDIVREVVIITSKTDGVRGCRNIVFFVYSGFHVLYLFLFAILVMLRSASFKLLKPYLFGMYLGCKKNISKIIANII